MTTERPRALSYGTDPADKETVMSPAPGPVRDLELRRLRHDAGNLINQIIGYAEMLGEDAEEAGEAAHAEDAGKIVEAARKILALIDGVSATRTAVPAVLTGGGDEPRVSVLPERPEGPGARPDGRMPGPGGGGGAILVVDDNELNRDMLARQLGRRGYTVTTAESGPVALRLVKDQPIELVLLDVNMPEMDGYEVLTRLRADHDMTALPVIMATARDASEDVVKALDLGANDYVTKPLDIQVVVARVAARLAFKRALDEISRLNARLQQAQERASRLAESSAEALHDVEAWSQSAAAEVARAIGVAEIGVWISDEREVLVDVTSTNVVAPTAADLRSLATSGRPLVKPDEVVVPILGMSGQIFGALVVPSPGAPLGDVDLRLVESFARQLGGAIELRRTRGELSDATRHRHQRQEDLVSRGLGVLQLCPRCGRCYDQGVATCEADGAELASPPLFPFRIGRRYRLVRLLGQGGMGMVFHAHDERLDREVAVKVVRSEHLNNDMIRRRFEKEARAVARIEHPGVVAIYDSGELDDGGQFIVMELLRGASLGAVISRCGPGTPQQVARLVRQTSSALSAAHRAGIVHRDIKPDNVFLVTQGEPERDFQARILDFGIAKELDVAPNLTQTGMIVGTPHFMSPEQLLGQTVDARSDVWSFAAMMFLALTGRRVSLETEMVNILLDITHNDPPPLSSLVPDVPPEIDQAFAWALARSPEDRPTCAETWASSFVKRLEAMPCTAPGWDRGTLLALSQERNPELDELLAVSRCTRPARKPPA